MQSFKTFYFTDNKTDSPPIFGNYVDVYEDVVYTHIHAYPKHIGQLCKIHNSIYVVLYIKMIIIIRNSQILKF